MIKKLKRIIRILKLKEYKFPINKNGETQIWTPIAVKNREELINYLAGFHYNKNNTAEALSEVLPDMVLNFLYEYGLITGEDEDEYEDKIDKGWEYNDDNDDDNDEDAVKYQERIIGGIYNVFSNLNIFMPINQLSSINISGVMPNGKIESTLSFHEKNEILIKTTQLHSNIMDLDNDEGEDFLSDNFLYYDCPFCGAPHFFKNIHDIPYKDYYCMNCGNLNIQYTNVNPKDFLLYTTKTFSEVMENRKQVSFIRV